MKKVLREKQQVMKLGVSRSTIRRLAENDPAFPKAIRLGPNSVGRYEDELDQWLDTRERG